MSRTSASSVRPVGAAKALWARAGLWRLSVMSAGLLTLLFVLFPPERKAEAPAAGPLPAQAATYVPQAPVAAAPVSNPAPVVGKTAATGLPVMTVSPAPTARALPSTPQTAAISMATPSSGNAHNTSGVDDAMMGRTYSGAVTLNNFKVPLPRGEWAMLANSGARLGTAVGSLYFLGRIEHKRLVGVVSVAALRYPNGSAATGFPAFKGCGKDVTSNLYLGAEAVTPFDHQACWRIFNFFTAPWQQWADRATGIGSLDRAAAGDMAAKGVTYPQDLVAVRFGRSEKWGLLEVTYLFNPETEGIKSETAVSAQDSEWSTGNIARFPGKGAYVDRLITWGKVHWPLIKQAFDDAAPPAGAGMTWAQNGNGGPASQTVPGPPLLAVPPPSRMPSTSSAGGVSPLDIRMGDDVATVKAILKATQEPQAMERPRGLPDTAPDMSAGKTFMHVVDKGVWVFFDPAGKVYSVRLDAPFSGDIKGIRLGDGLSKIASVFGEPLSKPGTFGNMLAYRYALDETRHVRFDLSGDTVRQIFITR